jgi:hypothetical protein
MVLTLALIGSTNTGAAPEVPKTPAAQPKAPTPLTQVKPPTKKWVLMGLNGSQCKKGIWTDADNNRNQSIDIQVLTALDPPVLQYPVPPCAKESGKGKLTFKVGTLPAGYSVEIDMEARPDKNGKPAKGPFISNAKSTKFPAAGRCVLTQTNDSCEFKTHNPDVLNDTNFGYNVYLYDSAGSLVDMKDPGIMTIENP